MLKVYLLAMLKQNTKPTLQLPNDTVNGVIEVMEKKSSQQLISSRNLGLASDPPDVIDAHQYYLDVCFVSLAKQPNNSMEKRYCFSAGPGLFPTKRTFSISADI